MERPFYEADGDRTNLVPSLQQDAPWVPIPDACAGAEPIDALPYGSAFVTRGRHDPNGQASTKPDGWLPYRCPDASAPTAVYDAYGAYGTYYNVDSSTMSLGYSDVHNTPSNQGQGPHLTSNPYSAGTVDGSTQIRDYDTTDATYGATNTAYGDASAAYGDASAAYGAMNAAYATAINTCDLARGIWPSTDPVSTLMGYNHGAADINPGVYPLVPNPTIAPGNLTNTPIQAVYEPAVANTDGSRPQCSTCKTTFKRASDLARHEKKHQARRAFKCSVPGCSFKGSYRKDKLDAHVKSCHACGAA
ncbi:hypothetical protein JMJ35_008278 [Cladonia borealis]|uniref:C2H2-type domain-containing protein n=1 Tax=Cladonia borealis TaxID=184061 RepID=A0AA39QTF3_9LECA|nr:hypothetical protein JMJ35_008278 [Cladonia borealis]